MKSQYSRLTSHLRPLGAAILALAFLPALDASAVSLQWGAAGGGGGGTWDVNTTMNWFDGSTAVVWPALGGTNDDAVFGGTAGTVTLAGGGVTANDLTFSTANYVITNNVVTLNGSNPTISNAVTATIHSILGGTNGLVKTGVGALRLTATNTYIGGTWIEAGVVELSRIGSSGGARFGTGTITLGAGSGTNTARITSVNSTIPTVTNNVLVAGGSTGEKSLFANSSTTLKLELATITLQDNLSIPGNGTVELNSGITGTGFGLKKSGAGTLILRNSKTFTGTMEVQAGTVTVGAGYPEILADSTTLKISGGTFNYGANSDTVGAVQMLGGTLSSSGTLTSATDFDMQAGTTSAGLAGNVGLNKSGPGLFVLSGSCNYNGPTLVSGGTLKLTGSIFSPTTVSGGGALDGEGYIGDSLTFTSGVSTVSFDPATPSTYLTANLIDASAATVVINPLSAADGIALSANSPIVGAIGANFIPSTRGGTLAFDEGKYFLFYTNGTAPAANLKWVGNAANPTLWDVVVTTNWSKGGVTDRFYTGDNVTFDDSASSFLVAIQGGAVSPGSTVFSNQVNAYTVTNGAILGSGPLTKLGAGSLTVYSGGHGFTGGLTVNAGTLSFLGGANTFTGGLTNNSGMLVINNINQIGGNTGNTPSLNTVNLNGGTFSYTGPTVTSETLTFNLLAGTSAIDINDVLTGTNFYTLRTGAPVTGAGNLIKTGNGTLSLGKNAAGTLGNTFTGTVTVNAGTVDVRNPDSLGDTNGVTAVNSAGLMIFPFNQTVDFGFDPEPVTFSGTSEFRYQPPNSTVATSVTWTGPVTNNGVLNLASFPNTSGATFVINSDIVNSGATSLNFGSDLTGSALTNTHNITVNGSVTGPAAVTASGLSNSVYTLANNNYSGDTTVNGGTLKLALATLATNSTVIVASNAVLQLEFVETNAISTLVLDGVAQSPGVYSSANAAPYLAGNGSLLVTLSPAPSATNLTVSMIGGNQLVLNWPAGQGWLLQSQTNTLATGLTTNWSNVTPTPTPPYTNAVNPADATLFFRLKY